jgi:predicted DNA binding CopG/RHH family protein
MNHETRPIDNPKEIPSNLSDEERMDFLMERGVSEDFLANIEEAPKDERPRPRTKPINVRFDDHTLNRLNELAARRNMGYQTLLKQFVTERLYEEEKKEAAVPTAPSRDEQPSAPAAQKRSDWLNHVHDYLKEHEELLEDPELTSIATSRMASDSATMLKELGQEIGAASRKPEYPASRLHRMEKAFNKLEPFVVRVIETYKERFGMDEEEDEGEYDIIREAQRILENA